MRNDLHANLTVRIFTDRKCFGPGVAELLRRVRELHSLRAAAMSMNMAYSKAWTVLRTAQEGLGVKLLRSMRSFGKRSAENPSRSVRSAQLFSTEMRYASGESSQNSLRCMVLLPLFSLSYQLPLPRISPYQPPSAAMSLQR